MTWTLGPPTPFGDAWERIQLDRAPLIKVVAQIRFAPVMSVSSSDYVASFQESIRHEYPALDREMQQKVVVTPKGAQASDPATIWRFRDADDLWRLSLAPDFVALETQSYTDRHEFHERFGSVVAAVETHIRPSLVNRIGVRYVDRIEQDQMTKLSELIRLEMLGLEATELGAGRLVSGLTEARFLTESANLKAQWGFVPASASHDPVIPPVDSESWILDLDASTQHEESFQADSNSDTARKLGEVIYRFFRWAVSDSFISLYGGRDDSRVS